MPTTDSPRGSLVQGNDDSETDARDLVSPVPIRSGKGKRGEKHSAVPQLTIPSENFVTEQLTSRPKVSFTPETTKPAGAPSGPPETWGFADASRVPTAPAMGQASRMPSMLTKKRVHGKKAKVNFDNEDAQSRKGALTAPANLKRPSLHEPYMENEKRLLDWNRLNSRDTTNMFATRERIHDALQGVYYAHPHQMVLDQHLARAGLKSPRSQLHRILEISISCKDLLKRGSGLEPDPLCKVFCRGVLSKKWLEVFCTDWRAREQSPNFAKILRIGVPDNCGPVRFVVYDRDHKKRNAGAVQIGVLECTLQEEVLEACAHGTHFSAALRDVAFDVVDNAVAASGAASDGEGEAPSDELGQDGGRECGSIVLKIDVLHDPAILSVRLRQGLDFVGSKPPDSSTQMSSSQKYVPKFQRALQQLSALATDLFGQFHLIDARGDVIPRDKVDKSISPEQFFNLLNYAGVLQGVQAALSGAVSSILDWEGRIGSLSIEEARSIHRAVPLRRSRSILQRANASSPPAVAVLGRPKSEESPRGPSSEVMNHDQFAESIKRVCTLLQDKHDKARDAAIKKGEAVDSRPSTAGVGMVRQSSRGNLQAQPPAGRATSPVQAAAPPPTSSGGRRLKGSGGMQTLRTPLGTFRRLSSRRAGRESTRTRLGIVDGEGYPSGSVTARPSTQRTSESGSLGTPRPLTSRSQTWNGRNLEPLEHGAGGQGGGAGRAVHTSGESRGGTLRVREFGKLLDVAAWSPDRQIQSQAAPAIAALALSSGSNNHVVQSFGAVKVMMDLFSSTDIPQVRADCMDAISQMVRSNVVACRQFVAEGGLDLTLRSTKEEVIVRRRCLQVLESVLLESEADIGDRYAHTILLGICALVAARPQDLQERAARLLVRMTKQATAKAQVWEPLREVELEEAWVVAEGVQGERNKRNAIRALCKILASSKHQYSDLTKPSLYPSKLYDSRDYSSASYHSVGNALLDFFWSLEAPTNDSHKTCVGFFVAQGLCEVLAKRLAKRTDNHLMEEDITCLRCLTRLVTAVADSGGTDGVMPPEAQAAAVEVMPRRGTVPFKWMTPPQLAAISETAKYRYVASNETIVRQGQDGTSCFIILSGSVKVLRRIRSETHELAVLKRGDEYGSASLLLQQARSATLVASTPCEVMEINTADLVCVAREEDSLDLFGKILEYMENNGKEELRVPRLEIQRAMGRKAMASMAIAQERIKQVLLESVSSLGRFEEPLKSDLEVQNLSCALAHITASRTPYAIQVWNAGLPIPILSLTSSQENSVARRACEVVAALCSSQQVCDAIAPFPTRRRRSQEPAASDAKDGNLPSPQQGSAPGSPMAWRGGASPDATPPSAVPPELPGVLVDCVIRGLSLNGEVSLLAALASLLLHPGARPLVFARCPAPQLLAAIQGASPAPPDSPLRAAPPPPSADGPASQTPEHLLHTIRALLGLGEERDGRVLIQSPAIASWLDEQMSSMESPDRELVSAYSRFITLVNSTVSSDPSTPMSTIKSKFLRTSGLRSSVFPVSKAPSSEDGADDDQNAGGGLSTWAQQQQQSIKPLDELDEKALAKELVVQKRKQIARLMQIAQKQAEEEWQSNVQWVLHGKQPRGKKQSSEKLSQLARLQTVASIDVPRTDNQVGVHQAILGMQESDIAEMSPEMAPFIRKVQASVASFDMAEHQRQKEIALKKELEDKNKKKYKGPDLTSAIKARRQRAVAQLKGKATGSDSDGQGAKSPNQASDGEGTPRVVSPSGNAAKSGVNSPVTPKPKSPTDGKLEGANEKKSQNQGVWDAVVNVSATDIAVSHHTARNRKGSDVDNDMWRYGTILAEAAQAMLRLEKCKEHQIPNSRFRAAARAALCIDRICRRGSPAFLQASHVLLRIEAENKAKAAK